MRCSIFIIGIVLWFCQVDKVYCQTIAQAEQLLTYNEFDSALAITNYLLENEPDSITALGKLYELRGRAFQAQESFASSLDNYLRARQEYQKLENHEAIADINVAIGQLYVHWGVPVKALDYFADAREGYAGIQDTTKLLQVLSNIGKEEEQLQQFDAAINTYNETLSLQKELKQLEASIITLKRISDLLIKNGKPGQALAYDLEILSLQEAIQDKKSIAETLNNIGFIYDHLNEKELALQYFIDAQSVLSEIYAEDEFYVGEPTILINIGLIYKSMGDLPLALDYFFKSLKTDKARDQPLLMTRIYNHIAFSYFELQDLERSKLFIETAINQARLYDGKEVLMNSYQCLSDIYGLQGRYKQALENYKTYEKIRRELEEEKKQQRQAQLERKQEVQQKEQEIKLLMVDQQIKDLALRELQLESSQRERDIELLQREKELQQVRLQNQKTEREKAEAALKLTQSQLEAEKKDNEIAMLQKDRFIQDLALKQKALEEAERQKEIELLERNQAIQDLELIRQKNLLYFTLGAVLLLLIILFLIYRSYRGTTRARKLLQYQNTEINRQKEEITSQHSKLERSYENIKLLGKIGSEITANLSIDKIQAVLYKHVQQLIPTDNFGIGLINADHSALLFSQPIQQGKMLEPFAVSLNEENRLPIHCFKQQKEILIHNFQLDFNRYVQKFMPSMTGETAHSIIYQPLEVNNKAIGVITVQSYEESAYSEYHLNILRNLATHVAIAIENAFAYEKIAEKSHILEVALSKLKAAQAKLVQAEKMASLGELTAGIAHEINNPINFVYAGVDGLKSSLEGLIEVLDKYDELENYEELDKAKALLHDIKSLKHNLYFDETKRNVFEVVNAIKEGAHRTSEIVNGLRNFSRLDEGEMKEANIHVGLENTLVLLTPKLKEKSIEVSRHYDDLMPEINCYPGQLNQVFMNILSNAIEAVALSGKITIVTRNHDDNIVISIRDDGRGIPKSQLDRIFEPFYTTKDLGHGTGLGLSISFGIIQKHQGTIEVKSKPGSGSAFIINIPKGLA